MHIRKLLVPAMLLQCLPVHAETTWTCNFWPAGHPEFALTANMVEFEGMRIETLFDDYSGRRRKFEVIANSESAVVAVAPSVNSPSRDLPVVEGAAVITLNKDTGAFRMHALFVSTSNSEIFEGTCKKDVAK